MNDSTLQKCQDFSQQLLESGSAFTFRVSIWNGMCFSLSSPGAERNSPNWKHETPINQAKKKSPSMRRRDQQRWEINQARKGLVPDYPPPPVTGQQPPVIGHQPPEAGPKPPVTGQHPPVTGQQPPVTCQQPPVTGQHLPVTDQQHPVTGQHLPATGQEIPESDIQEPLDLSPENEFKMEVDHSHPAVTPSLSPVQPKNMAPQVETQSQETSPDSSPREFSINSPISDIFDFCDWPDNINKVINNSKNSNGSVTVTTVINTHGGNELNSAIGSLKRTLKKCNVRSIEPRRVEHLVEEDVGNFAFEFKLLRKNIKATLMNIKKNWMPINESHLSGFLIKESFFENSL